MNRRLFLGGAALGLASLAGLFVQGEARSQDRTRDPLVLYPGNYSVRFENQHVRVLDFRLAKGATETTHDHPRHVAVFLTDVRIRFTLPDGTTRIREARAGETAYSEPTAHASENIGPADAHGVLIEFKAPTPGTR